MATPFVRLTIQAIDRASNVIKNIGKNLSDSMKQSSKAMESLKRVGEIATGMLVAEFSRGLSESFTEGVKLAGQIETLHEGFKRLVSAQEGATLTLEDLRKATKGAVSDVDLLTSANQYLMLNLPVDKMEELFEASMRLGAVMGIDTKKAVESLTIGLGRQSKLILDNLGITFESADAYEWWASQIGKASDELTENEKRTAWVNYAIEKITENANKLGDVISETQLAQERWNVSMQNLKVGIGRLFAPLGGLSSMLSGLMPFIGTLAGTLIPQLGASFISLSGIVSMASKLITVAILGIPIIGWIAGIISALTLLYVAWENNWLGIRDVFTGVWNAMVSFVQDPIGSIQNAVGGFCDWVSNAFQGLQQNIEKFMGMAMDYLKEEMPATYDFLKNVQELFGAFMRGDWYEVGKNIREILQGFAPMIQEIWNTFITSLQEAWSSFTQGLIDAWINFSLSINEAIKGFIQGVINFFTTLPAKIGELWNKMLWGLVEAVKNFLPKILNAFKGWFTGIGQAIGDFWRGLTGGSIWLDLLDDLVESTQRAMGLVRKEFTRGLRGVEVPIRRAGTRIEFKSPLVSLTLSHSLSRREIEEVLHLIDSRLRVALIESTSEGALTKRIRSFGTIEVT